MAKRSYREAFPGIFACAKCEALLRVGDSLVNPGGGALCLQCTGAPPGAVGPPWTVGWPLVRSCRTGIVRYACDELSGEEDGDEDEQTRRTTTPRRITVMGMPVSVTLMRTQMACLHLVGCRRRTISTATASATSRQMRTAGIRWAYEAKQYLREYKGSARGWHQLRLAWIDRLLRKGCRSDASELCMLRYADA